MAAGTKYTIDVQTRGAKNSEKQVKGVSSSLKSLAKSAALAAGAYFGARALLNAIKQSIDLFGKQELAEKKLESALGKTSNKLLSQAKALQQVTAFGDENIIEAQALIGAFVKEEDAIAAATKATLDLAAAKGFDLVASADLVSKTLGSSTNALSRYGIMVEGAVGSTERLNSLTENIAKVFGGQATAQAETLSGAMAQMNNAIGDAGENLGELLSPAVQAVAGFLKTAAENVGDFFKGLTETSLQTTIRELEALGVSGEALMRLKNIQLDRDIKVLNSELEKINRTGLDGQSIEKRFTEIQQEKIALLEEIGSIQTTLTDEQISALELQKQQNNESLMSIGYSTDGEMIQNRVSEVKKANLEIDKQTGVFQQTKLDGLEKEEEAIAEIAVAQAKINALEIQKTNINKEKKKEEIKDNIDGINLEGDAEISKEEKLAGVIATGIKGQADLLMASQTAKTGIAIKEGTQNAYTMAQSAYKAMASIPIVGPALGMVAAAAAFAYGMKQVSNIRTAQYGADFVTDGPQMMMVGEGSGPERVQVTPLSDPNLEGPQGGGGIVLNIQGNVLHESFVEDQIIPQIREGLRMGENLGI